MASANRYKILVVDDGIAERKSAYELLKADSSLEFSYVMSGDELARDDLFRDVDGFLVDINLANWGKQAGVLIADRLAGASSLRPIFLISEYLDSNGFTMAVMAARDAAGVAFGDIFSWHSLTEGNSETKKNAIREVQGRILRVLGEWYRRNSIELEGEYRILHLSDPQFGDPSINSAMRFNEGLIGVALEDKLGDCRRSRGELVDLVVISGDISYSGQSSEYNLARDWIVDSLCPKLWPNVFPGEALSRVILVPGNHDANLRALACEHMSFNFASAKSADAPMMIRATKQAPEYRSLGFQNFLEFLWSIDQESKRQVRQSDRINWVVNRFLHLGIQFVLLNTAGDVSCEDPDCASVSERELSRINAHMGTSKDNILRICVGHHPIDKSDKSDRAIQDGGSLINFLRGQRVSLYLHGHAHTYDTEWLVKGETCAVMSPSSTMSVYNGRQGFNLIRIERRSPLGARAFGATVETCEFHGRGQIQWLDSAAKHDLNFRR